MPDRSGRAPISSLNASSPPADAPIPTTGNVYALGGALGALELAPLALREAGLFLDPTRDFFTRVLVPRKSIAWMRTSLKRSEKKSSGIEAVPEQPGLWYPNL